MFTELSVTYGEIGKSSESRGSIPAADVCACYVTTHIFVLPRAQQTLCLSWHNDLFKPAEAAGLKWARHRAKYFKVGTNVGIGI